MKPPEGSGNHGQIVALQRRPAKGADPEAVDSLALAVEDGVRGDYAQRRKRQITLLSQEAWADAAKDLGREVSWRARRANVLISGVDLARSIGLRLRLGDCVIHVHGETDPCATMDRAAHGLKEALMPDCRGGVYGEVIVAGTLRPGDAAVLEDQD